MSHDAEIIANAIAALKPTPDYLKDYIFPISMAFFSALLGGLSALHINRRQELKNVTKENFIAANQLYTLAQGCLSVLISIKDSYQQDIKTDEPLARAAAFPTVYVKLDDITFNTQTLYFIRPAPTANMNFPWKLKHKYLKIVIKQPSHEELRISWRNTVRINNMFYNYNHVMGLIRARNPVNEDVKHKVSQGRPGLLKGVSLAEVQKALGEHICGHYVEITEAIITTIDYVISELHLFLVEFPAIAESNIELSRIREMGRFPKYENKQESFLQSLIPIMKPDYKKFAEYTGEPEEKLRKKYTYGDAE